MSRKYSIGTLLAALTLLIGCGGSAAAPKNLSGNSSASQLTAASAVQFGMVAVGATRASTVAVSNTAPNSTNVIVSQINVAGPGFRLANSPALPITITPGESVTLGLEFSPLSKGSATGTVSILSDATNPVLPVALAGNGNSATTVSVSPAVLNFGGVGVGNSAVLTGTLVAGTIPVTVTSVDQSGQGYALSGISFPVTLAAGQQLPFSVTFTPQSAGTSSGSLAFVTDSGTPAETLTGSGGQSSGHTVNLSWSPDASPVLGYNLYRGAKSGGPYVKITASPEPGTSYSDSTVQSGATYYYVATSVSSGMLESGYSNQTIATVP
jgi:hypothetical protein